MEQTYRSGRRTDGKKEDREEGGGIVEGWKSMERLRNDDVPVNSDPAQVLYSFDIHSLSSNKSSAQLAIVLEPEQDVAGYRKGDASRTQGDARSLRRIQDFRQVAMSAV